MTTKRYISHKLIADPTNSVLDILTQAGGGRPKPFSDDGSPVLRPRSGSGSSSDSDDSGSVGSFSSVESGSSDRTEELDKAAKMRRLMAMIEGLRSSVESELVYMNGRTKIAVNVLKGMKDDVGRSLEAVSDIVGTPKLTQTVVTGAREADLAGKVRRMGDTNGLQGVFTKFFDDLGDISE